MKKVGIILVNYKTYVDRYLEECRDSLRLQDYPSNLVRVYIVDNTSSEESRAYCATHYPEATVVPRVDGNYAAANNAGIKQATADGCHLFVIANMDVKYDVSWLSALVKGLEDNPTAGIVQSKILLYPQNTEEWQHPLVNTYGNIMHYLGFGFTSHYKEPDVELPPYVTISGYASGCSFIVSKEVLEKIGGYDEEYYMYHDDVEMSWRARLSGYDIVMATQSVIYHKYEFGRSVLMIYYMERNRYLAMFHYYKLPTLLLLSPLMLGMELGMLLFATKNGWLGAKWKAIRYFWNIATWKKIVAKRRQVKLLRKRSDRELTVSFSGKVLFQEIDNVVLRYIANPVMAFYWKLVRYVLWW